MKRVENRERAMVDHLAWAQGYRDRAAKCQLSAKTTSSVKFGECYRLLENYYLMLANLEENFGRKQVAALMPPVSLKEVEKKRAFAKQAENPADDKPAASHDRRAQGESPTLSVTARMAAVRQLQGTSPLAETGPISVPPSAA
jgi:hypothetical protein